MYNIYILRRSLTLWNITLFCDLLLTLICLLFGKEVKRYLQRQANKAKKRKKKRIKDTWPSLKFEVQETLKPLGCLVCDFKQLFSVFKQHFTHFNALFHLHVFPQIFSNNNFQFLNTYTKRALYGYKIK